MTNLSRKLHANEEILVQRGGGRSPCAPSAPLPPPPPPPPPPPRSATAVHSSSLRKAFVIGLSKKVEGITTSDNTFLPDIHYSAFMFPGATFPKKGQTVSLHYTGRNTQYGTWFTAITLRKSLKGVR